MKVISAAVLVLAVALALLCALLVRIILPSSSTCLPNAVLLLSVLINVAILKLCNGQCLKSGSQYDIATCT